MPKPIPTFTLVDATGLPTRGDSVLDDLKLLAEDGDTIINHLGEVVWTAPSEETE